MKMGFHLAVCASSVYWVYGRILKCDFGIDGSKHERLLDILGTELGVTSGGRTLATVHQA